MYDNIEYGPQHVSWMVIASYRHFRFCVQLISEMLSNRALLVLRIFEFRLDICRYYGHPDAHYITLMLDRHQTAYMTIPTIII